MWSPASPRCHGSSSRQTARLHRHSGRRASSSRPSTSPSHAEAPCRSSTPHVASSTSPTTAPAPTLSAARDFHELPPAVRSELYSLEPVSRVLCTTLRNDAPWQAANPDAIPVLPWRDALVIGLGVSPPGADLGRFPAVCQDLLLEYRRVMAEFAKKEIAALLSEALGVGAERLEKTTQMEAVMACHYYPPCPEPTRVIGSMDHTDSFMFTVLAQDGVGGLACHLDGGNDGRGEWVDVPPVPDALVVNIGDVLKVLSNDEYKSINHMVSVKSTQDSRVSISLFDRASARARHAENAPTVPEFHHG